MTKLPELAIWLPIAVSLLALLVAWRSGKAAARSAHAAEMQAQVAAAQVRLALQTDLRRLRADFLVRLTEKAIGFRDALINARQPMRSYVAVRFENAPPIGTKDLILGIAEVQHLARALQADAKISEALGFEYDVSILIERLLKPLARVSSAVQKMPNVDDVDDIKSDDFGFEYKELVVINWFVSDPVTNQINDVIAELSRLSARCLSGKTPI